MMRSERIFLKPLQKEAAQHIARALGVSPVLAALLWQRDICTPEEVAEFFEPQLEGLHDPWLLRDMDLAVGHLLEAIEGGLPIFIHGDYDVDGACATTLLAEALPRLGAVVGHHVPDRFSEGYGVSVTAVEQAARDGYKLLLSADCGSSSLVAVRTARELGMTTIITDHHHLPAQLPEPDAFINPQRSDCAYPFKGLCGTAVAFKLICALFGRRGLDFPTEYLDLVAMATIADVVPLCGENRCLVHHGLQVLARLERPGLRALAEVSDLLEGPWGSFAVGFGLGPRLNAAGRLQHAKLAVALLMEQDLEKARTRAQELDALNRSRRNVEKCIRDAVESRFADNPERLKLGVIVEGGEDWHHGVVGITASRLVDKYAMPAFVMGRSGDIFKGSARSPENVDLFELMSLCSDVFLKFGGHERAAGFSIAVDRLDEMRERLAQALPSVRRGEAPLHVDYPLSLPQASLELARELTRLEPVGEGNRQPLFLAERVRLEQVKTMGKDHEHLRFLAVQNGIMRKAVAFRMGAEKELLQPSRLYYDIVYRLQEESYQGDTYVSLHIEALIEPPPALVSILSRQLPLSARAHLSAEGGPDLVDARNILDRRAYLEGLNELVGPPLLVVETPAQAEKVRASVAHLQPRIEYYHGLKTHGSDIVLLYPPSHLDWLSAPAVHSCERVHCLFGDRELAWEAQRQRLSWLDRSRLEAIWRVLVKHSRQGRLHQDSLLVVEREVSGLPANGESVRAAVGVLEELGWLHWESEGEARFLRFKTQGGRRLEESRRFAEQGRRRTTFERVHSVFLERKLRLWEASARV